MNAIERAKNILLQPRETWHAIASERTGTRALYLHYLLWLALIPAVCGFIGMSMVGVGTMGVTVRVPLLAGLLNMVLSYVLSVAGVYVLGLIVDGLAGMFGGRRDAQQAQKVVVYAGTAALVGGVFSLWPMLSMLGLLAALYSLYLLYTGLPVLMQNPPEKSLPYTAVVVIAAIVLAVVVGAISSLWATQSAPLAGRGSISVDTPDGRISIDTARLQAAGQQMEEAARRMEAAQKSQDPNAMAAARNDAIAAAMGAMGGGQGSLPAGALKAALPDQLGGLPRTHQQVLERSASGLPMHQATAEYAEGDKRVHLEITDLGALGGLAQMAGMVQGDKETDGRVEKVQRVGNRTLHEAYEKDGSQSVVKAWLGNGLVVQLEAENLPIQALRALLEAIDLATLEALPREPKP